MVWVTYDFSKQGKSVCSQVMAALSMIFPLHMYIYIYIYIFKNMLFKLFTLEMSKLRFREFKKPANSNLLIKFAFLKN